MATSTAEPLEPISRGLLGRVDAAQPETVAEAAGLVYVSDTAPGYLDGGLAELPTRRVRRELATRPGLNEDEAFLMVLLRTRQAEAIDQAGIVGGGDAPGPS